MNKLGAQDTVPLTITAKPWFLVRRYGRPLTQIVFTAFDMAVAVGAVGTGGVIPDGSAIVCTLTGHGLKDPDTAVSQSPQPMTVSPTLTAVRDVILQTFD